MLFSNLSNFLLSLKGETLHSSAYRHSDLFKVHILALLSSLFSLLFYPGYLCVISVFL
jgi:hypothetical protein